MSRFDDIATADYAKLLADSYQRVTRHKLIESVDIPTALYHARFALVAHGIQSDPIFCYANLAAQTLFEYDWDEFVTLPSRLSAEPDALEDRARLFERAKRDGYVDYYAGIRISKSGKRFYISETILWQVIDTNGNLQGQAAAIRKWAYV